MKYRCMAAKMQKQTKQNKNRDVHNMLWHTFKGFDRASRGQVKLL